MYCMDGDIAGATTILEHMKQVKIYALYICLSPHENYDTEKNSNTFVQCFGSGFIESGSGSSILG
jgi:hypothetical protein